MMVEMKKPFSYYLHQHYFFLDGRKPQALFRTFCTAFIVSQVKVSRGRPLYSHPVKRGSKSEFCRFPVSLIWLSDNCVPLTCRSTGPV